MVVTGGEPMIWKPFLRLAEKHSDIAFMPYTNGTVIDEELAEKIANLGNIYPCISIAGDKESTDLWRGKGVYEKAERAMKELKERGVFFGFSATHTRENHKSIVNEAFFDEMISKGSHIGWLFTYVPLGKEPNPDLMPTGEQRIERYELLEKMRKDGKPIVLYDFWMDGPLVGGCIGWGKKYVHINADGVVEPCAFIHFGKDNIKEKSLAECLNSDFLKEARRRIPFDENLFAVCPYIDNPEELKSLVEEFGVNPTHPGAEQCISGPVHEAVLANSREYKEALEKKGLMFRKYAKENVPR